MERVSLDDLATDAYEMIGDMVVASVSLRKLLDTVGRLSQRRTTVLIQGESGTGKELVAKAIHQLGGNSPTGPFIVFNCSNLIDALAESQLFGHVKGAFTDARFDSQGYFRAADGGTLFLDEIGELPMPLQPKLLRAVENNEVQPVGSTSSLKVDVRIVAATNRDIAAMVQAGRFRGDLYYRLNMPSIHIPPLRDRRDDLQPLTAYFIQRYNRLFEMHIRYISGEALQAILSYDWPGNVRELDHAIQNAILLCEGEQIEFEHLPLTVREGLVGGVFTDGPLCSDQAPNSDNAPRPPKKKISSLDESIKEAIINALNETKGNRRQASRILGISRPKLYRLLARYHLLKKSVLRDPIVLA